MAVLTPITEEDARVLVTAYGLPEEPTIEGISGGSVNSNFALVGPRGRVFLRIYEERDRAGAERETAMIERLARAGVPTPAPLRRLDGGLVTTLRGKAAALFPWRDGHMRCQASVTPEDARKMGVALARVHEAGKREEAERGRFGYPSLLVRLERIEAGARPELSAMAPRLRAALADAHADRDAGLPRGLTHTDLFRDNVLWDAAGDIAALLDFESACEDTYAYDLMVTVLSWCVGDALEPRLARAMVAGYQSVRALEERERRGLLAEGSFAALRFTITRITDFAMRADLDGPRTVKDWRRFMMRYEELRALGAGGLAGALGL
jgi:homoserine kinase type II